MLVKFEQKSMVQTTRYLELFFFDKKTGFYNHLWQSVDAILKDVSKRSWNYCLLVNYIFPDYYLSVFQKLR